MKMTERIYTHTTPEGRRCRIVATDRLAQGGHTTAVLVDNGSFEALIACRPEDLTPIPVKRKGWMAVVPSCTFNGAIAGTSCIYATRAEAEQSYPSAASTAVIEVEWEESQPPEEKTEGPRDCWTCRHSERWSKDTPCCRCARAGNPPRPTAADCWEPKP